MLQASPRPTYALARCKRFNINIHRFRNVSIILIPLFSQGVGYEWKSVLVDSECGLPASRRAACRLCGIPHVDAGGARVA